MWDRAHLLQLDVSGSKPLQNLQVNPRNPSKEALPR